MLTFDTLDLYRPKRGTVIGRHSIWLEEECIKIPFQFGGQVQKFRHPREPAYPLQLLIEEYMFLMWLSLNQYAPPVGGGVY